MRDIDTGTLKTELAELEDQQRGWQNSVHRSTRIAEIRDELARREGHASAVDAFQAKALARARRGASRAYLQELCREEAPEGYAWSDLSKYLSSKGILLAH